MILDIKVPRALREPWTSWAEKSFAKKAKLPSLPLARYLTEAQAKKVFRPLEEYTSAGAACNHSPSHYPFIDYLYDRGIDALRYNGELFVHPHTVKFYLHSKLREITRATMDASNAPKTPKE